MENVIAGPHPKDIVSLRPKLRVPSELKDIRGWRIAYSIDLGYCEVDAEVAENTESALEVFRGLGCSVEEVDLGWTWATLSAAMNHLGHLFGTLVSSELGRHRLLMTNYAREFGEFARTTSADDFLDAMNVAGEMYERLGPMLEKFDVFICPTTALAAVAADHDSTVSGVQINGVDVDPMLGWVMTYPFNMMSRCPVMSVPSGRVRTGVPSGIQIVGRSYDDVRVFRAAAAYEKARGWLDTPANRPAL
jgi:amidase